MFKKLVCATLIGSLVLPLSACSEKKTVCGIEVETAPDIGDLKDVYTIKLDGKIWKAYHHEPTHYWHLAVKAGDDTYWYMQTGDTNTIPTIQRLHPENKDNFSPFTILSLHQIDCKEQKAKVLLGNKYDNYFGKGKIVHTYDVKPDDPWFYFLPTKHYYINAFACGKY